MVDANLGPSPALRRLVTENLPESSRALAAQAEGFGLTWHPYDWPCHFDRH